MRSTKGNCDTDKVGKIVGNMTVELSIRDGWEELTPPMVGKALGKTESTEGKFCCDGELVVKGVNTVMSAVGKGVGTDS